MNQFYTYIHCKPNGDPFYVGKGKNKRAFRLERPENSQHQFTVNKYGKKNIQVFIFNCESEEQAFKDEIQQISQFRKEGYDLCNHTNGGDGPSGLIVSDEGRRKMSEAKIGKKRKPFTDETRLKMSNVQKGRIKIFSPEARKIMEEKVWIKGKIFSKEIREKISENRKGIKPSKKSIEMLIKRCKDIPLSIEHRKKISESKKGKPWTEARIIAQNKKKEMI
jgi:hypothetical protein